MGIFDDLDFSKSPAKKGIFDDLDFTKPETITAVAEPVKDGIFADLDFTKPEQPAADIMPPEDRMFGKTDIETPTPYAAPASTTANVTPVKNLAAQTLPDMSQQTLADMPTPKISPVSAQSTEPQITPDQAKGWREAETAKARMDIKNTGTEIKEPEKTLPERIASNLTASAKETVAMANGFGAVVLSALPENTKKGFDEYIKFAAPAMQKTADAARPEGVEKPIIDDRLDDQTVDGIAENLMKQAMTIREDVATNNPAKIGTYKNINGVGDFTEYVMEAVTRNLGQLAISMGTGGITSLGARKIIASTGAKIAANAAAKGLTKEATDKLLETSANKILSMFATAGAAAGSIPMETGSIAADIYQETGKIKPKEAIAGGVVAGLLDTIEPVIALKKAFGKQIAEEFTGNIVKRLGKEGAKQFFAEAFTEAPQTIVEEYATAKAANRPMNDITDQLIDSWLQGGFSGGVIGVASQGVAEARTKQPAKGATQPEISTPDMRVPETKEAKQPEITTPKTDVLTNEPQQQPAKTTEATGAPGVKTPAVLDATKEQTDKKTWSDIGFKNPEDFWKMTPETRNKVAYQLDNASIQLLNTIKPVEENDLTPEAVSAPEQPQAKEEKTSVSAPKTETTPEVKAIAPETQAAPEPAPMSQETTFNTKEALAKKAAKDEKRALLRKKRDLAIKGLDADGKPIPEARRKSTIINAMAEDILAENQAKTEEKKTAWGMLKTANPASVLKLNEEILKNVPKERRRAEVISKFNVKPNEYMDENFNIPSRKGIDEIAQQFEMDRKTQEDFYATSAQQDSGDESFVTLAMDYYNMEKTKDLPTLVAAKREAYRQWERQAREEKAYAPEDGYDMSYLEYTQRRRDLKNNDNLGEMDDLDIQYPRFYKKMIAEYGTEENFSRRTEDVNTRAKLPVRMDKRDERRSDDTPYLADRNLTEFDKRTISQLEQHAEKVVGLDRKKGDPQPLTIVDNNRTTDRITAALQKIFPNLRVVSFQSSPAFDRKTKAEGIYLSGLVLVNSKAQQSELFTIGHELSHRLFARHPDLGKVFTKFVSGRATPETIDGFLRRYKTERALRPELSKRKTYNIAKEEVLANIGGGMWADPKFWRELYDQSQPLFQRVLRDAIDIITDVINSLRNIPNTANLTNDLKEVRRAYARMVLEASKREGGNIDAVFAKNAPLFSRINDIFQTNMFAEKPAESAKKQVSPETSEQADIIYLKAVESGDMETAQKMIDEAAEKAGYDTELWHGTTAGEFNSFAANSYFSPNKKKAESYTAVLQPDGTNSPKLYHVYVKSGNIKRVPFATLSDDAKAILNRLKKNATLIREGILDNEPEYIVKNSNQIKSADPVTYDDNGKVIPLSERFNPGSPDIRYSRAGDEMADINDQIENLEAKTKNWKDLVPSARKAKDGRSVTQIVREQRDRMLADLKALKAKRSRLINIVSDELFRGIEPVYSQLNQEDMKDIYDKVIDRTKKKGLLSRLRRNDQSWASAMKEMMGDLLTPLSTRISKLSPSVTTRLRKFEYNIGENNRKDTLRAHPWLVKFSEMDKIDQAVYDIALKNGDFEKVSEINAKHSMEEDWQNVRTLLDDIYIRLSDNDFDLGHVNEYFPRKIIDAEGLLTELGSDEVAKGMIDDEIAYREELFGRPLTQHEMAQAANHVISRSEKMIRSDGSMKERKIFIDEKLDKYYDFSPSALLAYIGNMNKMIEMKKFSDEVRPEETQQKEMMVIAGKHTKTGDDIFTVQTGKRVDRTTFEKWMDLAKNMDGRYSSFKKDGAIPGFVFKTQAKANSFLSQISKREEKSAPILEMEVAEGDPNSINLDETIGNYIVKLIKEKKLKPEQQDELVGLLKARFNYKPTQKAVQGLKNIGYLTSMGSGFSSFITQLGDLAWAYYNSPKYATKGLAQAFARTLSGGRMSKNTITKEDLGIERIGEEFRTVGGLGKAINQVFKYTFLNAMDNIGKEALINTTFYKFQDQAKKNNHKLVKELKRIFGDESTAVLEDLKNGNKESDNVKFLLFNKLLDYQPIAMTEMPKSYLTSPRGRIFYALKTFTIKQLDVFRREGIDKIINGKTKTEKAEGLRNLMVLAALVTMANAGADQIKDWLFMRKSTLSDKVIDNLLRLVGISRYTLWEARRNGLSSAIWNLVKPPLNVIELPLRDIENAKKAIEKDEPVDFKNFESWGMVPFFGKHYDWWFGAAHQRQLKRQEENSPYSLAIKEARKKYKKYSKLMKDKKYEEAQQFRSENPEVDAYSAPIKKVKGIKTDVKKFFRDGQKIHREITDLKTEIEEAVDETEKAKKKQKLDELQAEFVNKYNEAKKASN